MNRAYPGDSVFVEIINGTLKLTTENGGPFSVIFLEPSVYNSLKRYVENNKQLTGSITILQPKPK